VDYLLRITRIGKILENAINLPGGLPAKGTKAGRQVHELHLNINYLDEFRDFVF